MPDGPLKKRWIKPRAYHNGRTLMLTPVGEPPGKLAQRVMKKKLPLEPVIDTSAEEMTEKPASVDRLKNLGAFAHPPKKK